MAVKTWTSERVTSADINTYLTNSGLVYVSQTTVGSGSATATINSCFNSTYDNYRVVVTLDCTAECEVRMKMRDASGADSTANYAHQRLLVNGTGTTAQRATGGTYGIIAFANSTTVSFSGDVLLPNVSTDATFWQMQNLTRSETIRIEMLNTLYGANKAFTGFEFTLSTGTIDSAVISVYGYRKP